MESEPLDHRGGPCLFWINSSILNLFAHVYQCPRSFYKIFGCKNLDDETNNHSAVLTPCVDWHSTPVSPYASPSLVVRPFLKLRCAHNIKPTIWTIWKWTVHVALYSQHWAAVTTMSFQNFLSLQRTPHTGLAVVPYLHPPPPGSR